ncbi:histidine kinase dimerization/phospho-acceptor domain-containing protein [Verrucomicrobiota bacterium]
MPESEKKDANPQPLAPISDAAEIVRVMGLVFSNSELYGANHGVTKKAIEDSFALLGKTFENCKEISFTVSEEGLLVNGDIIELKNPLMKSFVTQMLQREINSFSISQGLSHEQYHNLVEALTAKPKELKQLGGFAGAIGALGLENVRSRKVVFKQVTEEEAVVSREGLEKVVSKDKLEHVLSSGVTPGKGEGDEEGGTDAIHVDNILAFIKGDVSVDNKEALSDIKQAASHADKLGEIILQAAEIKQEKADIAGGESFGDLVVGCLRRTYEGLSKDPAMKTQKGKKNLAKTLMLLEKDILDKMRQMGGEVTEEDQKKVAEAVEAMEDELKIDSLADEYIKKSNAIEANEKRILRFIKSKGVDGAGNSDLKEKLLSGGLSLDGWNELLVKSGAGGAETGFSASGGNLAAVGQLATLLTRMEESFEKESGSLDKETQQEVDNTLKKVDQEVRNIVANTEHKIEELVKDVKEDEEIIEAEEKKAKKEGKGPKLTRKKMLEVLAEIVQELCQPLAVISCSIDMMKSKYLGEVTKQQEETLELAFSSGERLKKLIDKLIEIAGMPETRNPDEKIISSLYE